MGHRRTPDNRVPYRGGPSFVRGSVAFARAGCPGYLLSVVCPGFVLGATCKNGLFLSVVCPWFVRVGRRLLTQDKTPDKTGSPGQGRFVTVQRAVQRSFI